MRRPLIATALASLALAPALAQAQEPVTTPQPPLSQYATVDSVKVTVLQRIQPHSVTVRGGQSTVRVRFRLEATCRYVDEMDSAYAADNYSYGDEYLFTAVVSTSGGSGQLDPEDFPFCQEAYEDGEIDSTFTEAYDVTRTYYATKWVPKTMPMVLRVAFQEDEATLDIDVIRQKRFWRTVTVNEPRSSAYIRRVYADNEPDRYWNICINQNVRIWYSQGRAYCNVRFTSRWREAVTKRKLIATKLAWRASGYAYFHNYTLYPSS